VSKEDFLVLECLDDIYLALEKSLKKIQPVRSIHRLQLEHWAEEIRNHRRIFEEISLPARLIVEHLMSSQLITGQVGIETGQLSQGFSSIRGIKIEQFGIIKIKLGELEVTWRDEDYSYYLYPDKVELRARDEKSGVKLFFSIAFTRQAVEKYPELLLSEKLVTQILKLFKNIEYQLF
jgi:hypothetical protein